MRGATATARKYAAPDFMIVDVDTRVCDSGLQGLVLA